jgi:Flp pilus assembly protein TadG
MKRRQCQRLNGSEGQALIEFALILPLFLLLLFGMIDFGRAYSASVTLTNAAREGARYGVIQPTNTSGIISRVQTTAGPYNDSNLGVTPSCSPSCSSGNDVIVQTTYQFSFITPLAAIANFVSGGALPSTLSLKSSANMRIE